MVTEEDGRDTSMSPFRKGLLALAFLMMGGLAACSNGADKDAASPAAPILDFAKDGSQWPSSGGGYDGQRFSPLQQITTENVGQLGLAWVGDSDFAPRHRGDADRGGWGPLCDQHLEPGHGIRRQDRREALDL